jgi:nicotinamide phosphoribosyltransferase
MNFLEKNKGKNLIACVGDSYDIFNFTDFITKGEFKNKIENEDYPTFVIRPDSGDAVDVINTMLNIMEKNNVAFDVNDKGYKIFKKYRIIWGDGINMDTMRNILTTVTLRGYSTQNIAFGSGGWLMQQHDRDTLGFAIKCSEITFKDGSTRDIFKDPITAPGKKSKKGKVTTYKNFETK